ncbi:MAG: hypothetical protein AB1635_17680 [Acidobacteriota bacterium]
MTGHRSLLTRVRAEFREMPGMRLTIRQAQRLWHLPEAECRRILEALVAERALVRRPDGAYTAVDGATAV